MVCAVMTEYRMQGDSPYGAAEGEKEYAGIESPETVAVMDDADCQHERI